MIDLKERIAVLETALNTEINKTDQGGWIYGINDVPRNTRYHFSLFFDMGDLQEATKQSNIATVNICGIVKPFPESIEGASAAMYNASFSCSVDLLIPLLPNLNKAQKRAFLGEVRKAVDAVLAFSSASSVTDGGIVYFVGLRPEIMQTGERAVRETVGDSIVMTLNLNYFIIANGVSSDAATISIGAYPATAQTVYENVLAIKWGAMRRIISENGVPSNSTNGVAKFIQTGSVYTLHIDLPARVGTLYEKYLNFIETGVNTPFTVKIVQPMKYTTTGGVTALQELTSTHTMMFSDASNSGETGRGVAVSITMQEVMT